MPLLPIRPAIFTFETDDAGLGLVRDIIAFWQSRYGMSLAESVELLNERLGARDGKPAAKMVDEGYSFWFHESAEHIAREMIEGMYRVKKDHAT